MRADKSTCLTFTQIIRKSRHISTKIKTLSQILVQVSSIKFCDSPLNDSWVFIVTWGHPGGHINRHGEAKRRVFKLFVANVAIMSLKETLCGFSLLHSIACLFVVLTIWSWAYDFLEQKSSTIIFLKKNKRQILLRGVGRLLSFQHKGTSKSLAESC
jgi:hypothetical protein